MVDTKEMLEEFLEIVNPVLANKGLVTFEKMNIRMYRGADRSSSSTA
jgi:PII-like signaling protein